VIPTEYPKPETVVAIQDLMATGSTSSGRIGRAPRDHSEMLQGFRESARRGLLSTSNRYLAINEPVFEQTDAPS